MPVLHTFTIFAHCSYFDPDRFDFGFRKSYFTVIVLVMIKFIRRFEVWVFLLLLVLVNAVFVTCVVKGVLPAAVYGLGRFALLAFVLFGLVWLVRGLAGVSDILQPMLHWRRSPWFYLFALAWTASLCWIVLLVKGFFTGDYLTSTEVAAGLKKVAQPRLLLTLAVSSFAGEIVWVSYALRRLTQQFTPYLSALIVGAVWTAWWLPMAVHNFGIIPDLPIAALLFNQMGIAAMCAFVYHHAKSGFLVLVMQIMFNSTILVFPITPTAGGPATYWAFALTYFTAATLLFLRFGPKPLGMPLKKKPVSSSSLLDPIS